MVGPLRFGDAMESARVFGRPDHFRWTQVGYCELCYARAGFQLDFDSNCLAYAAFFIGPDASLPEGVSFSAPRLDSNAAFSQAVSPVQLEAMLGRPKSTDRDEDEIILLYEKASLTLEFEYTPAGKLKRWNIYPTEAASHSKHS